MSRRDNRIADLNKHKRADLNGVAPYLEATFIYGTRATWWNGWDGGETLGGAARIKIHRDGWGTSHSGACAIEPAESPVERVIRQHGLEHREAAYLRDRMARPLDRLPARAIRLGVPERTLRRVVARLEARMVVLLRECAE